MRNKFLLFTLFFFAVVVIGAQAKTYKFTVNASYWWNRMPVSLIYDGNNLKFESFLGDVQLDVNGVTASISNDYRTLDWRADEAIEFKKNGQTLAFVYYSGKSSTGSFIEMEYIQLKNLEDFNDRVVKDDWLLYNTELIRKDASKLDKNGDEYKFYATYQELFNDIKAGRLKAPAASSTAKPANTPTASKPTANKPDPAQENDFIRKSLQQYVSPTAFQAGGKSYKMYWTNPNKGSNPQNNYVRFIYFVPDDFQSKNSAGKFRQPPILTDLKRYGSGSNAYVVATVVEDKYGTPKTYEIRLPAAVLQQLLDLYNGKLTLKIVENSDAQKIIRKAL